MQGKRLRRDRLRSGGLLVHVYDVVLVDDVQEDPKNFPKKSKNFAKKIKILNWG